MSNLVTGYSYHRARVLTKTGALQEVIDFSLPNEPGIIESYDIVQVAHEFTDYSVKQSIKGYKLHWTIPYSSWIQQDQLMKIDKLLWYLTQESTPGAKIYDIYFIPHTDLPGRSFLVYCSMNNFEMGTISSRSTTVGHNAVMLVLSTVNLESSLKWTPIVTTIYNGFYKYPYKGSLQV